MEVLRGRLFSRSTLIAFTLALLCSNSASVSAMGPGSPTGEARPTPTQPRFFTINEVLAKRDTQKVNTAASDQAPQIAGYDPSATTTLTPLPVPQAALRADEPFGLSTFRAPEGLLWVKWRKLGLDLRDEAKIIAQCQSEPERCANPAARNFLHLIDESRKLPDRAKIDRINRTINAAVRYISDHDQHGVPDVWTAPLATLTSGQGDCEDYAIAKYIALRQAGFTSADLRLLIVHDRVAHQDHAVVGVRHNGRWLLLDNRHELLIEQKDAWHFTPLFALDQDGVNLFAAPYGTPPDTVPALVATGPANAAQPGSTTDMDASGDVGAALRLDTFEAPILRGRL